MNLCGAERLLAMAASPIRILLVEDEKEERISFTLILERAGYFVVPTETGRQALEQLNAGSFQAAIIDLHLEDMTAFDLIPQIRSLQPFTQILILTAEIREEYQQKAEEMRVASYLLKPVAPEALLSDLSKLFN